MPYYFCTLFDKNFAHKGLALYDSIRQNCGDNFHIWILCLDIDSEKLLAKMNPKNATVLNVSDLGDAELLAIRSDRKANEFSWTCKPPLIRHALNQITDGGIVNYLDADLFLFSKLDDLYKRFAGHSIIITPHRLYPSNPEKEKLVGTFNAGILYFRKDAMAMRCIEKWRKQCLDWCYEVYDDGKFGDQLYLNEWPSLYSSLHILNHKGVNTGSWNIKNSKITSAAGKISIDLDPLIWYHFHAFRTYMNSKGILTPYPVSVLNDAIYTPYVTALRESIRKIHVSDPNFEIKLDSKPTTLRLLKQKIIKKVNGI